MLVIGFGNPLLGDDGFGPEAAQRLASGPIPLGVEVVVAHQLTPEMAEDAAAADVVVFVDAREATAGEPAGGLRCEPVEPAGPEQAAGLDTFTHRFDPPLLVALARILYGRAPKGWLVSAAGCAFGLGDAMTPQVSRAAQEAPKAILDLLGAGGTQD